MDPVTAAVLMAVGVKLGEGVVTDCYSALKDLLRRKFGDRGGVVEGGYSVPPM